MLTDQERARIELDEQWRIQVRKKHERGEPRWWKIANSPVVIWALSAVVVTLLGNRWNVYQENQKAHKENLATIGRLDNEIAFRFSQVLSHLREATVSPDPRNRIDRALDALEILPDPTREYVFLYPQYERYSLPACVAELERHLALESLEDPELGPAIKKLSARRTYVRTRDHTLDDPTQLARAIHADMIAERWKRLGFYLEVDEVGPPPRATAGTAIVRPAPKPGEKAES